MTDASTAERPEERLSGFLQRDQRLLIGGTWVDARSGETFDVVDPSTGKVIARAAAGGAADIDLAVQAARKAFRSGPWPAMSGYERGRLLDRLASLIEANADELALIESLDGGNPIRQVRMADIAMALAGLRFSVGWTTKVGGEVPLSGSDFPGFSFSMRQPIGVAGLITPWNAPFTMAVGKLATALAVGCTCVLKPAELAPLSSIRLGELIQEAGFPDGVVNIVTGFGDTAGQALVDHPDVPKISFTGSVRVGRSIIQGSAARLKRVTLELGGKSPTIVYPDADIERATASIAHELFIKTGQFCAAGTRLFVHAKVMDKMVADLAARGAALTIGAGTSPGTDMGPVISARQLSRVQSYIDAAPAAGAEVIAAGRTLPSEGFFVEPTFLINPAAGSSVTTDEIFGPVLCINSFSDDDDLDRLAALANDTDYGLAAKIWTRDLGTAHRMARKIDAGAIFINGGGGEAALPFGGFKQSGLGREGGSEGVLAFTEVKSVFVGF